MKILILIFTGLIIFYMPINSVRENPELESCPVENKNVISTLCFRDSPDTGTWILLYTDQGNYEILSGFNNTCWIETTNLKFQKIVL